MSEEPSHSRALRVFGICTFVLYIVLAVYFWTAWSFKTKWLDGAIFIVVTGALVALYFAGLKFTERASTATIVIFAIGIAIVGFLTPPFDSTDVFFYMATGWQQTHYGGNPYSELLRDIPGGTDDRMIQNEWMVRSRSPGLDIPKPYGFLFHARALSVGRPDGNAWLDMPMPYGFLFALIARSIAWSGRGNFWVTLGVFNVFIVGIHAGIGLLLWKAGRLLPEGNGKAILYLYSWNPFVVLQYLADLHNDIIVAFLVVMAAYVLLKDRPIWSLPLLVAAGFIKYVTWVLVPFAFIFLVRRKNWGEGLRAILLSVAVVVLTAAPYISEATSFRYDLIWNQVSESTGSLQAFLVYSLRALGRVRPEFLHSVPRFAQVTQLTLWIMFAVFIVHSLYTTWRDRSAQPLTMIHRWTSILFALIFVVSSQFFAWYIGMLFPLALLTHRKTILTDSIVALSGAHILSFTFLRRKAIGYFLIATLTPILFVASSKGKWASRFIFSRPMSL